MLEKLNYIETKNKKYPIAFTFNVLEEIQNKYGSFEDWQHILDGEYKAKNEKGEEVWLQGEVKIADFKYFMQIAINEGIDIYNEEKAINEDQMKPLTSNQVGRLISEVGTKTISEVIKKVIVDSTSSGKDTEVTEDYVDEDVKAKNS